MTITAAAEALGVTRKTIYSLARQKRLHIIRNPLWIHGPVRIPVEDIDALKRELGHG